MLAALLLSAFAVYGFFSLLLAIAESCSDAVAVRAEDGSSGKSLSRRLRLASRSGREVVILLSDESEPSRELLSLGYAVYLRVTEEKGERDCGNEWQRA